MPPRKYKKRAPAKKTYKRKAPARQMTDGQSIICNAYCEIHKALDANNDSSISYSLNIDPKNALLVLNTGSDAKVGDEAGTALPQNTLTYSKFNTFKGIYNQYRINSATIKVRVDATCGLENAVITSNDKGSNVVVSSMASALCGAHKSHSMTTSRRELTYTIKNVGQDLDFLSTDDGQAQTEASKRYIKVFQKLPAGAHTCEHQVSVLLNVTLKDSKNLN
jgi:hypothetical protein